MTTTKHKLLASAAELIRSRPDRAGKRATSAQHPDDPAVVARQRGAAVAEKAESESPTATPGRPQQPRGPPPAAYTIPEFCIAYPMSVSFFHKLQRQGRGPTVMRVGARTLISLAAAEQWRREREAEAGGWSDPLHAVQPNRN